MDTNFYVISEDDPENYENVVKITKYFIPIWVGEMEKGEKFEKMILFKEKIAHLPYHIPNTKIMVIVNNSMIGTQEEVEEFTYDVIIENVDLKKIEKKFALDRIVGRIEGDKVKVFTNQKINPKEMEDIFNYILLEKGELLDLNISAVFDALDSLTNNQIYTYNEYMELLEDYVSQCFNLKPNQASKYLAKLKKVREDRGYYADFFIGYFLQNDLVKALSFFSILKENELLNVFAQELQIHYVNKFGIYEKEFDLDKLLEKQDILIKDLSKKIFFKRLVDELNLFVHPPKYEMSNEEKEKYRSITSSKKYPELRNYTKYFDKIINTSLRGKFRFDLMEKELKGILSALDHAPKTNMFLYRGIISDKIMDEFTDFGFMSKSLSPSTATSFAGGECCFFVFLYPNGTSGIDISDISHYPDEEEVLTYPGEVCKIVKKMTTVINFQLMDLNIVHVVGNVYDNKFQIIQKTEYKKEYDERVEMIEKLLKSHIDYNHVKNEINGFVYLNYFKDEDRIINLIFHQDREDILSGQKSKTSCEIEFDFDAGKTHLHTILDFEKATLFSDVGQILSHMMTEVGFELGEVNTPVLKFGEYIFKLEKKEQRLPMFGIPGFSIPGFETSPIPGISPMEFGLVEPMEFELPPEEETIIIGKQITNVFVIEKMLQSEGFEILKDGQVFGVGEKHIVLESKTHI